jgi:uncharacterized glyoxalase superfamily protein PhnB
MAEQQRVMPYLFYKNGKSAIDFLAKAFGFEPRMVMPGPGESVMHAELAFGGFTVCLGTPDGQKPAGKLPQRHSAVMVYVDDVDAHCARARKAGAKIETEPADQFYGDRTYNARDLEGQLWYFHQHVRDVSMEEMQAAMASMTARPETSGKPDAKPRSRKKAKPRAMKATAKAKKKAAKKK